MSHLSDAGTSGPLSRKKASGSSSLADAGTSKKIRTAYEKRQGCTVSQFCSSSFVYCSPSSVLCQFFIMNINYRLFYR